MATVTTGGLGTPAFCHSAMMSFMTMCCRALAKAMKSPGGAALVGWADWPEVEDWLALELEDSFSFSFLYFSTVNFEGSILSRSG